MNTTSDKLTLWFAWALLQPIENNNLFNQWAAKRRYRFRNIQKTRENASKWNRENRARRNIRMRQWANHRNATNVQFRLQKNLRTRIWFALQAQHCRSKNVMTLLGCTVDEFKRHIESQFQPGWSWENWGTVWEIDHEKPCAKFDLTDVEQRKLCFHFSNQRPLSLFENRSKGSK